MEAPWHGPCGKVQLRQPAERRFIFLGRLRSEASRVLIQLAANAALDELGRARYCTGIRVAPLAQRGTWRESCD